MAASSFRIFCKASLLASLWRRLILKQIQADHIPSGRPHFPPLPLEDHASHL
ncbi:rCG61104 [Rattus norvegicus]|uniref:RCG61104 n=1 Tax=Rattus norvegicus TaxID=10116 RepID=A6JKN2_RAT|nr:rCG61104 [Rattus norvegicus]